MKKRAIALMLCLSLFCFAAAGHAADPKAKRVRTSTTNFDTNLSSADTTVQKALDTLDDMSSAGTVDDDTTVNGTAVDTTANFKDDTDITFTVTDGGAGGPDDIKGYIVDDSHNHVIGNIDDFQEEVEDDAGAMFTGNTETRCTVTYQDDDGTIDVVVDDLDTNLSEEEVEDFAGSLLGGTETRIAVTYDDAGNAINFVVDDMNDDVPDAGDFGAANDLDANGDVADDSHNHVYSNIDAFTEANLYTILSDVSQFYEAGDKVGDADTLDTHDTSYFQIDLTDEASLYTALSDVSQFYEAGDEDSIAAAIAEGELADSVVVSADIKDATIVTGDISGTAGITLAQTAMTAGRSLTISTNDVLADAELYTDTKGIYFEDPTADDDFKSIWYAKQACTITSIWAESDQTVTFMLQVDDGSPADVDSVDLAPAAGTATDTSLDGDVTMAAGDRLDIDLVSVASTPTWVAIHWTLTYDD